MRRFGGLAAVRHAKIGKGGRRPDLGDKYFRSKMEANFWRYLLWLKSKGEIEDCAYEPREFEFPVKRGVRFYKPDFWVKEKPGHKLGEYYVETKGYMDAKSKTALGRMARHYPDVTVIVIDYSAYRKIQAVCKGLVSGWE